MKKVLVINDSKFECTILKDLLTNLGYSVKIANEYSALKEVDNYCPDIVISNLIMKETSGNLLINRIKDDQKEMVCLLSSCSELNVEDYKCNKVDGVIRTPISSRDLNKILEDFSSKSPKISKDGFTFCPYCGGKLGETTYFFCPYCGEKLNKIEARV